MYVLENWKKGTNIALICEDCIWTIRTVEEIIIVSRQFQVLSLETWD